jgi:hypothetical protein
MDVSNVTIHKCHDSGSWWFFQGIDDNNQLVFEFHVCDAHIALVRKGYYPYPKVFLVIPPKGREAQAEAYGQAYGKLIAFIVHGK